MFKGIIKSIKDTVTKALGTEKGESSKKPASKNNAQPGGNQAQRGTGRLSRKEYDIRSQSDKSTKRKYAESPEQIQRPRQEGPAREGRPEQQQQHGRAQQPRQQRPQSQQRPPRQETSERTRTERTSHTERQGSDRQSQNRPQGPDRQHGSDRQQSSERQSQNRQQHNRPYRRGGSETRDVSMQDRQLTDQNRPAVERTSGDRAAAERTPAERQSAERQSAERQQEGQQQPRRPRYENRRRPERTHGTEQTGEQQQNKTLLTENQETIEPAVRTEGDIQPENTETQTERQKSGNRRPRGRGRGRGRNRSERPAETDEALDQTLQDETIAQQTAEAVPAEPWDKSSFVVPEAEGKLRFQDLDIPDEILHAVADLNFQYCTPIQADILSSTLSGKDATGKAQTGTGKTAAFLITVFSRLLRTPVDMTKRRTGTPRALVLAPTRELVLQITQDAVALAKYTNLKIVSVYGGMDYRKQQRQLNSQMVDVVVATPGRLIDFHQRHDLHLSRVEILVIDEADRMLDMGFIPDVRRIVRSTPARERRHTLFFSATLNDDVERLAWQWTREAVKVDIEPEQVAVNSVEQMVYIVTGDEKFKLLYNIIEKDKLERVIIFANRRDEARTLSELLKAKGIKTALLSGDVDQKLRIRTIDDLKNGVIRVLVATDVASRGIHIEGISHVINYTLPEDAEDYVHRIGRTGRAGATGISISFASEDDSFQIPNIEKFLGHKLECTFPDDELLKEIDE